MAEATDVEEDNPRKLRTPNSRSCVDLSLSPDDQIFDQFFLHEKGDRETVRLLMRGTARVVSNFSSWVYERARRPLAMRCAAPVEIATRARAFATVAREFTFLRRGMPVPVTFGFPDTDGTAWGNYKAYVELFHPLISIRQVHPLCPFSKRERLVVFLCSLAFNFLWSEAFIHHAFGIKRGLEKTDAVSWQVRQFRALVKHVGTILYAVLIRQLVICPCLYQPLIDAACDGSADLDADELRTRADALVEWKWRGDRIALLLLLVHFFFVFAAVAFVAFNSHEHVTAERYGAEHVRVLYHVLYSELVNFVSWFIRFTPLFLLLFPIHRAQWYQGGTLKDYLLLRRSCRGVVVDARSPCVVPETTALRSARLPSRLSSVLSFSGGDMSTLRHA